jgi:hypothetical protein
MEADGSAICDSVRRIVLDSTGDPQNPSSRRSRFMALPVRILCPASTANGLG